MTLKHNLNRFLKDHKAETLISDPHFGRPISFPSRKRPCANSLGPTSQRKFKT